MSQDGSTTGVTYLHDVCHSLHDEPALAPSHPRPGALVESLRHTLDESGLCAEDALPPKALHRSLACLQELE